MWNLDLVVGEANRRTLLPDIAMHPEKDLSQRTIENRVLDEEVIGTANEAAEARAEVGVKAGVRVKAEAAEVKAESEMMVGDVGQIFLSSRNKASRFLEVRFWMERS